jgi:hypothetical protein
MILDLIIPKIHLRQFYNKKFKTKMLQHFEHRTSNMSSFKTQCKVDEIKKSLVQQIKSLQLKKAKTIITTNIVGILLMAKLYPFIN